ncbi:DUF6214 family protein [Streptomyces johnsoniae]|uniref:DUF6214 family protein n=1 Tax=Streptomyces johnsoniae TaxID=3075532 RepID=A0ABU2SEX3_9ACTN|nr:DUF6214 family protein [Streptomyces sp. DSM 41886]MDT0446295.1 DUF6214 family protein [Streptomyces sp. DSM 41886]
MVKSSFSGFPGGHQPDGPTPDRPVWELRGHGSAAPAAGGAPGLPPWFSVGLVLADGARIDVLAQVSGDRVLIEDMRADPPLPVDGFGTLTERIGEPLRDVCRALTGHTVAEPETRAPGQDAVPAPGPEEPPREAVQRAQREEREEQEKQEKQEERQQAEPGARESGPEPERPPSPAAGGGHRAARRRTGGRPGRRIAAEAYLAAQQAGTDPVLAVMNATGRSRRRSLRLIAAARGKGYLSPGHARR